MFLEVESWTFLHGHSGWSFGVETRHRVYIAIWNFWDILKASYFGGMGDIQASLSHLTQRIFADNL